MVRASSRIACAAVVFGMAGLAQAGPDWVEGGDAGAVVGTAQRVTGIGALRSISGSLSLGTGISAGTTGGYESALLAPPAPDLEDMYLVQITEPTLFSFTVGNANFDAQMWLFNITIPGEAFGLLANNDTAASNRPVLVSPATDGTGAMVTLPGTYAVAISGLGRVPVSASGAPIFNFVSPTEVSGPDGPGGLNAHTGWTGAGQVGSYLIEVEGVSWYTVPGPTTGLGLLFGAGLLGARRRR